MAGYYYGQLSKEKKEVKDLLAAGCDALAAVIRVPDLGTEVLSDIYLRMKLDLPLLFFVTGFHYRKMPGADHVEVLPDYLSKSELLYEGAPRSFEISAGNDVDWFKLVVPKRGARVGIRAAAQNSINYSLYREEDFLTAGDNAARIDDWYGYSAVRTLTLDAGGY